MNPLVALVLVLVAGAGALVAARGRALARPLPARLDPESPLAPGERLRLRRWERRIRHAFAMVGVAYLLLVATTLADAEPAAARAALGLGLLGAATLLGAAVQFSERCPRCGYNLGFQSRLLLPDACERCRGRLR